MNFRLLDCSRTRIFIPFLASSFLLAAGNALGIVGNDPELGPPGGFSNLCAVESIQVVPKPGLRNYSGQATCWVNAAVWMGADPQDSTQQKWQQLIVRMTGSFDLNSNHFTEKLEVDKWTSPTELGTCNTDPWAGKATCSSNVASTVATWLEQNFGWPRGNIPWDNGPISKMAFSPDVIKSLLTPQESAQPAPPTGVDAILSHTPDGKSAFPEVHWRAGDMSGNKWILQFDIEYADFADSTFIKTGQRLGLGPKQSFTPAEANMLYLFWPSMTLKPGQDIYFRVCAVNDAGRQCSSGVKARAPTAQELAVAKMSKVLISPAIAPTLLHSGGGTPNRPGSSGGQSGNSPSTAPTAGAFGAKRLAAAAGGPAGGSTTSSGGNGGQAGATPATTPTTRAFGAQRMTGGAGAPAAGGASIAGGSAGNGSAAGSTPGTAGNQGKPDLAVATDGMLVNSKPVAWNGTERLILKPGATHQCQISLLANFKNVGGAAAKMVAAELRDDIDPTKPLAQTSLPSLAAGQGGSVMGTLNVRHGAAATQINITAMVMEVGKPQDPNAANDRGTITLSVICKK